MHTRRQHAGFSLVELVVALAVAAVLLGVGVPSFTAALKNARIGAQYSQAVRSLLLARSEAVKSGQFVVVCSRSAPGSEQCGDADDWSNGWIVYIDDDSEIDDAAVIGAEDTLLSLEPALKGTNTVAAFASLSNGDDPKEVAHVRYLPRGSTNWKAGSIVICDTDRGSVDSRVLNVRLTGAIQAGQVAAGETIPRDAFNSPIDCGAS